MTVLHQKELLRQLFDVAVAAADPMKCVPEALPVKPDERTYVIGAGKAAARMAEAVESVWGPSKGMVITRDGYSRPCQGIEVLEASHPVPDQRGLDATAKLLTFLDGLGEGDHVIALISGGASALLEKPAGDISLAELRALNEALLASGAPIDRMNVVRKHVSRVKGGQLAAAAYPAQVTALVVSDVAGDDLAFIASGPTVGDTSTAADAIAVLDAYKIEVAPAIRAALADGSGVLRPDDGRLATTTNYIVAAPSKSLEMAAEEARVRGVEVEILGDAIEGEAREVAAAHAARALALRVDLRPGDRPKLLLSGGECTVTRRGDGVGGPNAEYALALALALEGRAGVHAIACDTDGVDGAADVAGAIIGPDTLSKAEKLGLSPRAMLDVNDSHSFFERLGDQVVPGPTLTNVNDFRAILIEA